MQNLLNFETNMWTWLNFQRNTWDQLILMYFYCHKAFSVPNLNSIWNSHRDVWCISTNFLQVSSSLVSPPHIPPPGVTLFYLYLSLSISISPPLSLSIYIYIYNQTPCNPRILIVRFWGPKPGAEDRGSLWSVSNLLVAILFPSTLVVIIVPVLLHLHLQRPWCCPNSLQFHLPLFPPPLGHPRPRVLLQCQTHIHDGSGCDELCGIFWRRATYISIPSKPASITSVNSEG